VKRAFAVLCALNLFCGCAAVKSTIKSVVADCKDSVTHAIALNFENDVTSAIICDAGSVSALPGCATKALTNLAVQIGWPAIDCILSDLLSKSLSAQAMSSTEGLIKTRTAAAIVWRSARQ
jgi:hypothetical protein